MGCFVDIYVNTPRESSNQPARFGCSSQCLWLMFLEFSDTALGKYRMTPWTLVFAASSILFWNEAIKSKIDCWDYISNPTSVVWGLFCRRLSCDRRLHSNNRLLTGGDKVSNWIFAMQFVSLLTIVVALEHLHFLLIIRAAEKLALLDDIVIALL